jgi:hypothetical protein
MGYRISLVRVYLAAQIKRDTPTPFAEIRAFIYLQRKPQARTMARVQERLYIAIDQAEKTIEGLNAGIEQGATRGLDFNDEVKNPTKITTIPATAQRKVTIDGLEVEQVDPDEMPQMYDGMFISKKFSDARGVDWRYFSRDAQNEVMRTRKILPLEFNKVYRYFARFNEEGKIDWEYDESQLERLEKTKDLETIKVSLIGAIRSLDTGDIQRDINILRELNERLVKLRGD